MVLLPGGCRSGKPGPHPVYLEYGKAAGYFRGELVFNLWGKVRLLERILLWILRQMRPSLSICLHEMNYECFKGRN